MIFVVNQYLIFSCVLAAGYAAKIVQQEQSKWLRLREKTDPNLDLTNASSASNVQKLAPKKP